MLRKALNLALGRISKMTGSRVAGRGRKAGLGSSAEAWEWAAKGGSSPRVARA